MYMMSIIKSLSIMIGFVILLVACQSSQQQGHDQTQTFAQMYPAELADVTQLEIRRGDGEIKTITDLQLIENLLEQIKDLSFVPEENQEGAVGFLYDVKMFEQNEMTFSFTTNKINGYYYKQNERINSALEKLFEEDELNNVTKNMSMRGYVIKREEDRILVISSEKQDFSATGGIAEYYEAIWFSDAPLGVKLGEKVEVWYEYVLTSYPGQSTAEKIAIMPTEQPIDATLTEAEAVAKALLDDALNEMSIYTVLLVSYDTNSKLWTVHVKDVMTMSPEEEITIEVSDH